MINPKGVLHGMFVDAKIETDRLYIRPYQIGDAHSLYQMTLEPGHFTYMPESPPKNIEEIHRLIKWSIDCNEKNTTEKIYKFNLSVFLKETGEFIGICGLGPNDINKDEVEVYYSLVKRFQGKGYAHEAARAVLSYSLNVIGLEKVVGLVHPDNIASLTIIKRLGMKFSHELSDFQGDLQEFNGYHLYMIKKSEVQ
ncbi:GNAT family N-acetyltransferase [Bacillus sp. AK128]